VETHIVNKPVEKRKEQFPKKRKEMMPETFDFQNVATEALEEFHLTFRLLYNAYQQFANRLGISGSQLAALEKLFPEDGLTIGELSKRMGLHASTLTGLVDRLEKDKLVYRGRSKSDRRVVKIFLTPTGREIIQAKQNSGRSFRQEIAESFLTKLKPAEVIQLTALLRAFRLSISSQKSKQG